MIPRAWSILLSLTCGCLLASNLEAQLFGPAQPVSAPVLVPTSVCSADLDFDGDLDVLSSSSANHNITWFENHGGLTGFGLPQVISTKAPGAQAVLAADLSGDGFLDPLSASSGDHKVAWYENLGGQGSFGPQRVITTAALGARDVDAADLDGDGDLDVLSASAEGDEIAWYENMDSQGTFGVAKVIGPPAPKAWSVCGEDLDLDGDMDILFGSSLDGRIAWHPNICAAQR